MAPEVIVKLGLDGSLGKGVKQAMQDIKSRVLEFLYGQVNKNSIPQIKKGMVEDLEKFLLDILNERQIQQMAARMEQDLEVLKQAPQVQSETGDVSQ